ncbi:MAG: hypothetical protein V3T30_02470 [Thermodesulfobacteriota bacterium]
MGLTLTLTDAELPASPSFIEFLHASLKGEEQFVGSWYRQEGEELASNKGRFQDIRQKAQFVVSDPKGKEYLLRSYRFFKELLTGNINVLREVCRFRFYFVIGIPRTGGTYLTKQIFQAGGIDYKKVQNALAHDGFPHLAYLSFKQKGNVSTNGLLQLAEYLTMVEIFFTEHGRLAYKGGIIVPKKFTKAVYDFDLIRELFGTNAEYLITLRHPLSVCKSILDKSGGMPENRKFALRSAIERWALDDWLHWGVSEQEIAKMDYVKCFLGYWKRFHCQIAMSGIPRMPTARIVPYGEESMIKTVQGLYDEFGVKMKPEAFKQADAPSFYNKAEEKEAEQVVKDVAAFWKTLGLDFPSEELSHRF